MLPTAALLLFVLLLMTDVLRETVQVASSTADGDQPTSVQKDDDKPILRQPVRRSAGYDSPALRHAPKRGAQSKYEGFSNIPADAFTIDESLIDESWNPSWDLYDPAKNQKYSSWDERNFPAKMWGAPQNAWQPSYQSWNSLQKMWDYSYDEGKPWQKAWNSPQNVWNPFQKASDSSYDSRNPLQKTWDYSNNEGQQRPWESPKGRNPFQKALASSNYASRPWQKDPFQDVWNPSWDAWSSQAQKAWNPSQKAWETAQKAWDPSQQAWDSSQKAWNPTQQAWHPAKQAWDSSQKAWDPTQQAWDPAYQAWDPAQEAWGSAQKAWVPTQKAWSPSQPAWQVLLNTWDSSTNQWLDKPWQKTWDQSWDAWNPSQKAWYPNEAAWQLYQESWDPQGNPSNQWGPSRYVVQSNRFRGNKDQWRNLFEECRGMTRSSTGATEPALWTLCGQLASSQWTDRPEYVEQNDQKRAHLSKLWEACEWLSRQPGEHSDLREYCTTLWRHQPAAARRDDDDDDDDTSDDEIEKWIDV